MIIPGGGILSDNVQDAIEEINDNKVSKSGDTISGNLELNNASATTSNLDSVLTIGNQIPEGTVGNSAGTIHIYARSGNCAHIYPDGSYPSDTAIRLPLISGRLVVDNDIAGGLPSPIAGYSEAGEAYYDVELNDFSLYILIVSVNGGGGSRFLTPDIYLIYVEDRNSHIVGAAQLAKRLTDAPPTIAYQSDSGKYRITKDNNQRRSSLFRLTQF